jgi:hypothetical protein
MVRMVAVVMVGGRSVVVAAEITPTNHSLRSRFAGDPGRVLVKTSTSVRRPENRGQASSATATVGRCSLGSRKVKATVSTAIAASETHIHASSL